MRDVLLLRLDAPLMSFGAPTIDNLGRTARHPSRSMLTGMFANALGWDHGDWGKLEALQGRLDWAARLDREGEPLTEYQTVDLGQQHLSTEGRTAVSWTTRGQIEQRAGGPAARLGTHQRWRDHWADAVYTVAIGLDGDDDPTIPDLAAAIRYPARPLFLGRKPCMPARPLFLARTHAETLVQALRSAPVEQTAVHDGKRCSQPPTDMRAWWPAAEGEGASETPVERLYVTGERDWRNQVHVGERRILHGMIRVEGA